MLVVANEANLSLETMEETNSNGDNCILIN
jgi:hypothetical protein